MNSSGSTKPSAKGILDHHLLLLSSKSNQGGKHDYDWLLTPPETQPKSVAQTRNTPVRSASTNRNSSILNTVSSYVRPSRSHPSTTIDRIIRPASRSPTHSFSVGPPNLRTCLPVSARPGPAMTVKGNVETINTPRHPSPVAPRGRLAEPPARAVESVTRKPVKVLSSESGTRFGRSILKKSLDMAIKHMDLRRKGVRPLPGSTLFPHSIRSSQPSSATASNNVNSKNGTGYMDNKVKPVTVEHKSLYSSTLQRVDVYESLRYDSIFLKEDLKNTSWLHGADEKSDQSLLFDNGFETLPEPFAP